MMRLSRLASRDNRCPASLELRIPSSRWWRRWCACAAALLWPSTLAAQAAPAHAARSPGSQLDTYITALLEKSQLADRVGLTVSDAATGKIVFAHASTTPLNPASNLKLLTAATAVLELGPEYRTRTTLYGRVHDNRVEGGLCLKSLADPTLTRADLGTFAQRLLDEGIREVDDVLVDGSYFDAQVLPPAFEQQPEESAPFRAAIAAVSVNANTYTLRLRPGTKDGAPTTAVIDGTGYFEIDNGLVTNTQPKPSIRITERDLGERVVLTLRGSLPVGSASVVIQRRVPSPLHYAGQVFIDALTAAGIKAPPRVRLAPCSAAAPVILQQSSPPLAQILSRLGKDSDNFVAEMLLKLLAAEHTHRPGTTADGAAVVKATMQRLNLPCAGLTMINGSGLFQGNLVSTELLSQLLSALYRNPSVQPDFLTHLAVAGADGTLAQRMRKLPMPRIVRAKTGTLNDVIALSGYVLGPKPERAYTFSYLANGITGKQPQARELIDQIVAALAAQLYKRPLPSLKTNTPVN